MKILVIPYNYPTPAFPNRAVFVSDQVKALRQSGHTVDVIGVLPKTISDLLHQRITKPGGTFEEGVSTYPAIRGLYRLNKYLQLRGLKRKLVSKLERDKKNDQLPDIVHIHNSVTADIGVWIKHIYGIPFVITEHSSALWDYDIKSDPLNIGFAISSSKANIAVSKHFSEHLSKLFCSDFKYIPNAVDTSFFRYADNVKDRKSGQELKLISVGNLTLNKNHQLAIKAIKSLLDGGLNIYYTIIGAGSELSNLKQLTVDLGLENRVAFTGQLPRSRVKELLLESDRFILPSLMETFGVALVEAMSCGLPVIALDNGGSSSIIHDDSLGIIAENESDFHAKIRGFVLNTYDHSAISSFVDEHFSYSAVSKKLEALYQ